MRIIELNNIEDPRLRVFLSLTERQLREGFSENSEKSELSELSEKSDKSENLGGGGLFIAESPKVIMSALEAGYEPVSLLCERKHIEGDANAVISLAEERYGDEFPVFTGSRELLANLTGYRLTRGVLCAMRRKPLPSVGDICRGASRLAVIDQVCDTTNIGAIFRSAGALGIDAVLLTRGSCDPLNRRAVRVSMGTVFKVPWTWLDGPVQSLNEYGFKTVALALTDRSVSIDDPALAAEPRLALVLGTEGDGLAAETITACDYTARIPMSHGVDSLNVAAASAVAFWQLRK